MPRHHRVEREKRELLARPKDRLPAGVESFAGQAEAAWAGRTAAGLQRRGLPGHTTAGTMNQAAVLQMQRLYGNKAVQRYLASARTPADRRILQRQLKPEKTKATAAVGTGELKFKADLNLSSDGNLSLDLGPAVDLKNFGMATTGTYDVAKGFKGVGELRLGGKKNYVAPKVIITPDGKATLEIGTQLTKDMFTFSSSFGTSAEKTTLGHTLGWKNPFGAERFDVKASLLYRLDEPKFSSAKLEANYKILGSETDKTAPYLMLTFEGGYTAPGPKQEKGGAQAFLLLRGSF